MNIVHGNAICYSGYREGQSPREGVYPTYAEIKQDLLILSQNWKFLRLYDCGPHAEIVLDVIESECFDFKVMLGVDMAAEMSNPHCPWGADFSEQTLSDNRQANCAQVDKLIELSSRYTDIVFSVSVGNEASVEWTDHMVSVDSLVSYVLKIKDSIKQPVTFCENYVPWTYKLEPLVAVLDFISIHTYPAWEYRTLDDALEYTKQNYHSVALHYPGKPVVITEAGWTTQSNGRGIETWNASQELQASYYEQLLAWTNDEKILTFVFEAFDEPWKGSPHPQEPEKHWGLFTVDRKPKLVMESLYNTEDPLVIASEELAVSC
ncbi:glycosyl hydrolase family 17 protein [Thalassotalea fonticola]|uniref:Endo-1,3-beta-glucanase btgC n=1 Tax=Thalassotalea fonticola TaxID=3065649 RepID=A0ABZ0GND5_9GAMM|nr:glycosyl hydrolase family 17 protein [Colwelliaceae bacterium S1-1]